MLILLDKHVNRANYAINNDVVSLKRYKCGPTGRGTDDWYAVFASVVVFAQQARLGGHETDRSSRDGHPGGSNPGRLQRDFPPNWKIDANGKGNPAPRLLWLTLEYYPSARNLCREYFRIL